MQGLMGLGVGLAVGWLGGLRFKLDQARLKQEAHRDVDHLHRAPAGEPPTQEQGSEALDEQAKGPSQTTDRALSPVLLSGARHPPHERGSDRPGLLSSVLLGKTASIDEAQSRAANAIALDEVPEFVLDPVEEGQEGQNAHVQGEEAQDRVEASSGPGATLQGQEGGARVGETEPGKSIPAANGSQGPHDRAALGNGNDRDLEASIAEGKISSATENGEVDVLQTNGHVLEEKSEGAPGANEPFRPLDLNGRMSEKVQSPGKLHAGGEQETISSRWDIGTLSFKKPSQGNFHVRRASLDVERMPKLTTLESPSQLTSNSNHEQAGVSEGVAKSECDDRTTPTPAKEEVEIAPAPLLVHVNADWGKVLGQNGLAEKEDSKDTEQKPSSVGEVAAEAANGHQASSGSTSEGESRVDHDASAVHRASRRVSRTSSRRSSRTGSPDTHIRGPLPRDESGFAGVVAAVLAQSKASSPPPPTKAAAVSLPSSPPSEQGFLHKVLTKEQWVTVLQLGTLAEREKAVEAMVGLTEDEWEDLEGSADKICRCAAQLLATPEKPRSNSSNWLKLRATFKPTEKEVGLSATGRSNAVIVLERTLRDELCEEEILSSDVLRALMTVLKDPSTVEVVLTAGFGILSRAMQVGTPLARALSTLAVSNIGSKGFKNLKGTSGKTWASLVNRAVGCSLTLVKDEDERVKSLAMQALGAFVQEGSVIGM